MIYLGPDPPRSARRANAVLQSEIAFAANADDHARFELVVDTTAPRGAILLTDLILDIGRDAPRDDNVGEPRAYTHWSRILWQDLAAGNDEWPDEAPIVLAQLQPRAKTALQRGKRHATHALVVLAICVAACLAVAAFLGAGSLPNAPAAIAPESAVLPFPPSSPDSAVDVRMPPRHAALARLADEPDGARECARGDRDGSLCIFN